MRDSERHPVFEFVVFALAGFLALVLAYFAWVRFTAAKRMPARGVSPEEGSVSAPADENPPSSGGLIRSGTVRAVPSIPPVKGSPRPPKKRAY